MIQSSAHTGTARGKEENMKKATKKTGRRYSGRRIEDGNIRSKGQEKKIKAVRNHKDTVFRMHLYTKKRVPSLS